MPSFVNTKFTISDEIQYLKKNGHLLALVENSSARVHIMRKKSTITRTYVVVQVVYISPRDVLTIHKHTVKNKEKMEKIDKLNLLTITA